MLKYCRHCIMPHSKPDLSFDDSGVCSACSYYENRVTIDWGQRKTDLKLILEQYRSSDAKKWDVIIPISGGKDSTYQVIKLLELGVNPLGVVATTCHLSEIGRKNIQNARELGIDIYEISSNPKVRRKLNQIGLTEVGDISWPEHCSIFTVPVRIAVQTGVRLIVWGENPQHEYGGPATNAESPYLTRRWLEEFGGLMGLRVTDLIGRSGIQSKDLINYTYPSQEELVSAKISGLFLGHFLPWDGYTNTLLAQAYGLTTFENVVEGSVVNYENLDNHQTGIHDYFKFLKFGFGRATDIACLHIRRKRLTRDEGMSIARLHDGRFPWTYLGMPLKEILKPLSMSIEEFIAICDKFTNRKLFHCDAKGNLIKDRDGNLTKLHYDND